MAKMTDQEQAQFRRDLFDLQWRELEKRLKREGVSREHYDFWRSRYVANEKQIHKQQAFEEREGDFRSLGRP